MIGIMIIIGVFILLGVFLINGKGASLIAGYNAKSEEELEEYDTVAVCKFMGKIMFALSFSMMFWLLGDAYDLIWPYVLGTILFIGISLFQLIYAHKWKRFRIKNPS